MSEKRKTAPKTGETERMRQCVPELVGWYRQNRRSLPWREDRTPYRVWIAEIMLQQTRIEAAIGYYRRFLEALPDVCALAEVEDDRLMKLWEGLGYYSRARNLKKAAQRIVKDFGGELPRTAAELKTLPGIGDYTAGAVASIAWGEPEPAVDGNVLRVAMRVLARGDDVMEPSTRREVTELLREVYPSGEEAALLTEGIMELGETVCLPNGEPVCLLCPLRELCLACAEGAQQDYPVRAKPKERRIERRTVLLLRCRDRFAVRRRPEEGLLAGLWEFPNREGELEAEKLEKLLGAEALRCRELGRAKHVFSHVEWHMQGYLVDLEKEPEGFTWLTAEEIEERCSIPTAFRYYKKKLHELSE